MNITNELINEIRNKLDIVEIISNYVPLTKRGKNYFGVCPFHDDHSPSMSVSPEKQIFTCFSCGASGNVFTFVSKYERINFYDAVRLLGKKVGYDFQSYQGSKNKNADLYEIYNLACKFYQNNLNTEFGKKAREYLLKRNIDKKAIKKFKIGLSLQKSSLTEYLLNKKIPLQTLIELGISHENGTDLFVNRIIFPLDNIEGNIVGFSGRIYNTQDASKYINTKETAIFKKGTLLYNYHQAKEPLKKNAEIIVMEGFMDVIRADTLGITNCVATMGTALTKQNALLLKKMANDIILCFDGDLAGEEATAKAITIFKEIQVSPKIIRLEEGLDPDDYLVKYGLDKFKKKMLNPESSIDFLMNRYRKNKDLKNVEDISCYLDEALQVLAKEKDDLVIELTLNKLVDEFKISYQILKEKYLVLKSQNTSQVNLKGAKISLPPAKQTQYDRASKALIFYMLKDEKIIDIVDYQITFFPDEKIRTLANQIIYYYHKYKSLNIADFISYISNDEEILSLFNEISMLTLKDKYFDEEIADYVKVINTYPLKRRISELNKELKEEEDPLKQATILSEILSLKGVKE